MRTGPKNVHEILQGAQDIKMCEPSNRVPPNFAVHPASLQLRQNDGTHTRAIHSEPPLRSHVPEEQPRESKSEPPRIDGDLDNPDFSQELKERADAQQLETESKGKAKEVSFQELNEGQEVDAPCECFHPRPICISRIIVQIQCPSRRRRRSRRSPPTI